MNQSVMRKHQRARKSIGGQLDMAALAALSRMAPAGTSRDDAGAAQTADADLRTPLTSARHGERPIASGRQQ